MSSVSIIVSCFNQNRSVSEIIDRLEAGSHTIQEVIVADDGSNLPLDISRTNSCSKRIHKYVFLTHENQGFRKCKILNQAIQESTSEYNVFLDGDCLPHKHFVKDHIAMAERDILYREDDALLERKMSNHYSMVKNHLQDY